MEDGTTVFKVNKVFLTAFVTMCVSVIGSAAKAYMDVETLKVEVNNYADSQREIKEDLREIKKDIKELIKAMPKEG